MREDVILHRIVTGDEKWVYYENVYLVGSRRYVRYKQQLMKRNQELKKNGWSTPNVMTTYFCSMTKLVHM